MKGLKSIGDSHTEPVENLIANISAASADLAQSKTGALIVLERSTPLGDLTLTGTVIDAAPSVYLIKNIFFNKAPLHDGALIIRDARLYAAGCLLPLSQHTDIIKDLGTRHRAAIGMSENSDAVVVVVSEETGTISIAVDGVLYRGYNKGSLESELRKYLLSENDKQQRRIGFKKFKIKSRDTINNRSDKTSGGKDVE